MDKMNVNPSQEMRLEPFCERVLAAAQQKYRAAIITYLIQALFYRKMLDFSID